MGTLTLNGRTIPSARLLPEEFSLLEWLDTGGIVVNEIRPAAGWPSDRTSLPDIVRGMAVVHEFLVPPSATVFDAVPVAGPLSASLCASAIGGLTLYRLQLVGRTASFDSAQAVHFATHQNALLVTTNDGVWQSLLQAGASQVQPGPCSSR
jgi:hypothetical protein